MPELPEVETVKRGLASLLPEQIINKVQILNPKSFQAPSNQINKFVTGSKIIRVTRRGKIILINLSTNYTLAIHLKMTGQLVFKSNNSPKRFGAGHPNKSLISKLPDKSTRVIFYFNSATLFFNDQRKFGWIRLIPTNLVKSEEFIKKLGPEPLSKSFTLNVFKNNLNKRPKTNIKATLLDQTVIAGIGNIYADEILFACKIHPKTLTKDLTKTQVGKLFINIPVILNHSIKMGGSTDKNYVDVKGNKNSYLKYASVFRKENQLCPRCSNIITKIKVAGRGTHVCDNCQKPPQY